MATIYIYGNFNSLDPTIVPGTVLEATASEIVISSGAIETIYYGSFGYNAYGVYGTLTGVTDFDNGAYQYIATGLDVNAAYIDSDPGALVPMALAGNDQFVVEAPGTHIIDGYGGYNTVYELGASTSYTFGSTAGAGQPGVEAFNLYNIQSLVFTDGVINLTTGVFSPNAGDANWLTFQNISGPLALWQMSGTTIVGGGLAGTNPGPTWHVEGTGHFYFGDASTDIVWQNDNGSVALWGMDGTTVRGGGVLLDPGPTWHVEGTDNFYGSHYSDILLQNDNGSVAIWEMGGASTLGGSSTVVGGGLVALNPGPTWHIEGTGAFYGVGSAAILFQNDNGEVALWDMSGIGVIAGGVVGNPGPGWSIEGTGDFYGDGNTDILWQNANGEVALWDMNGTTIVGGGVVATDPGPTWHIKGTGDFNSDGHTDIAFQNDNGSVAIWEMNGTSVISGGLVSTNPGTTWNLLDKTMQFIASGPANETLTASSAMPDEFVFTSFAAGAHTIDNFNPMQDVIEFNQTQFASFAAVEAATTTTAGGALINLGHGSSLLLAGVNPTSLHASDFALA